MKKIILSILCVSLVGCSTSAVQIVNYNDSHKGAVVALALQDPLQFFVGSKVIAMGLAVEKDFIDANVQEMEAIFTNEFKLKQVVVDSGKVVGFVEFFRTREMSIEAVREICLANGQPCNEEQILLVMPYMKRTNAECEEFFKIECLAISKESRRKGYARALVRNTIEAIKAYPDIKRVMLDVNASNEAAIKLYESEGFAPSENQPMHLAMMGAIQYEKTIR